MIELRPSIASNLTRLLMSYLYSVRYHSFQTVQEALEISERGTPWYGVSETTIMICSLSESKVSKELLLYYEFYIRGMQFTAYCLVSSII